MGWTGTFRGSSESDREFFTREFQPCEILACSKHGATLFMKLRRTMSDNRVITFAMVVETERRNGMFYYKDIDESMGPCEYEHCPLSILEGLDPPCNEYAADWRERVRTWHASRNKVRLKTGDRIRFEHPLRFTDGSQHSEFTVAELHGKRCYRAPDDKLYSIKGISGNQFQVIAS